MPSAHRISCAAERQRRIARPITAVARSLRPLSQGEGPRRRAGARSRCVPRALVRLAGGATPRRHPPGQRDRGSRRGLVLRDRARAGINRRGGFRDAARAVPRHEEPRERRGFGDQQGRGGGQAGGDIDRSRRRGERNIALTPSSSYTPRGRRFSGSNGDSAITFASRRSISTETVRSVPGLAISTGRQVCTSSRPRVCE